MKKVILFGAGNIGRGFLGQLFNQSGYKITFVEAREDIIDALNRYHSYRLKIVGPRLYKEFIIDKVKALNSKEALKIEKEIEEANIMATAVGAKNLPSVASLVARGIGQRAKKGIKEPINLIICENLPEPAKTFKKYLNKEIEENHKDYLDSHLGLVEAVVSRMVPIIPPDAQKKDPTFIMAEEYSELPVDKKGFRGNIPKIKGIIPYENLFAYEERKLFTHNAGHAICAYLGYLKGYKYIWEAIKDKKIYKIVRGALKETGEALIKKHKFKKEEQEAHIKDLLQRFANQDLADTIERVARDPLRKLAPGERLIGSAKLSYQYGIIPENISKGIAAAIFFDREEDEEAKRLTRMREEEGIDIVLQKICQINPQEKLALLIKEKISTILQRRI